MPTTSVSKPMAGYWVYPTATVLSGKNFTGQIIKSTPNIVQRPRPLDTSAFSLSNTPRTYSTQSHSDSEMGFRVVPGLGTEYRPVAWNGGLGQWSFPLSSPYNLQTKLALKIKNQKANLAITLAQYRELCTVFTGFAGSVLEAAANLQRLKNPRNWLRLYKQRRLHSSVRPIVKSASGAYLAYLFGVRQFADDFQAISEALRRRFEDPMYLTLDPMSFHERLVTIRTGGSGNEVWHCETADLITTRVKAQYRVFPNDQVLSQMGMTNLPALIYDFIPFSFVLNWLIPIGQSLAALDALEGVSDLRWYSTTRKVQGSFVEYPAWKSSSGVAHATYKWEEVTRSGISTVLKPPLPRFESSKNALNVLTAVALLGVLQKQSSTSRTILQLRK